MCDREEFEAKFPPPEGVEFNEAFEAYQAGVYSEPSVSKYNAIWSGWQAARAQKPNLSRIAQKKLDQMGATIHGVLVKNEAGAWAAVSGAGRVMWLDGFEGKYGATTPQPGENWKLMPVHATPEMIERGKRARKEEFLYHEDANLNIQQVWKAMAAIAPNPPAERGGE